MKILIFGGTTEGRQVALMLKDAHEVHLSVATQYGAKCNDDILGVNILENRLNQQQMQELICQFDCVVDAAHPFAKELRSNIINATMCKNVKLYRVIRQTIHEQEGAIYVQTIEQAVDCAKKLTGNILATTGSKAIAQYAKIENFDERVFARVLPDVHSINLCKEAGLPNSHIIAMQGPFCQELNYGIFLQYNIKILVTKESGDSGGFIQKLDAAMQCGVMPIVIVRPIENGLTVEQLALQLM